MRICWFPRPIIGPIPELRDRRSYIGCSVSGRLDDPTSDRMHMFYLYLLVVWPWVLSGAAGDHYPSLGPDPFCCGRSLQASSLGFEVSVAEVEYSPLSPVVGWAAERGEEQLVKIARQLVPPIKFLTAIRLGRASWHNTYPWGGISPRSVSGVAGWTPMGGTPCGGCVVALCWFRK